MDDLEALIERHVETHHLGASREEVAKWIEEHQAMVVASEENGKKLDFVIHELWGESSENPITGDVEFTGDSIISDVAEVKSDVAVIKQVVTNGGVHFDIPWRKIGLIILAQVGTIVAAILIFVK